MRIHASILTLTLSPLLAAPPNASTSSAPLVSLQETIPSAASRTESAREMRSSPTSAMIGRALERMIAAHQARIESRRLDLFSEHTSWQDPWIVSTRHYQVRAVGSYRLGNDIGDAVEWMLGQFQTVLGSTYAPGPNQQVFVLPNLQSYNVFGDNHSDMESSILGGFYAAGHTERPIVLYDDGNPQQMKMWATHASFLQFVAGAYKREMPPWAARGLASYFSLFWDFQYGVAQLKSLQERGQLIPLRTLLNEPLAQYRVDPHTRFMELGMFMSYMLNFREETRDVEISGKTVAGPFSEYLRNVFLGMPVRGSEVHDLLTTGLSDLQAEFFAYNFGG